MKAPVLPQDPYTFKPFKHSSHDLILKLLTGEKTPLRVLDAGAAAGYLGWVLRQRGHYVVGLEKDPARAAAARGCYDAFYEVDLENYDFPQRGDFDCILFADVLEHLPQPEIVLQRCRQALKPSGKIIVSIPNIANVFIRLSLLCGKFDYTDRGIMDRGHVRFFTLRTLKALLRGSGFDPVRVVPTTLPFQLVWPATRHRAFEVLHQSHYLAVRAWKTLLAYQFVVEAKPRAPNAGF